MSRGRVGGVRGPTQRVPAGVREAVVGGRWSVVRSAIGSESDRYFSPPLAGGGSRVPTKWVAGGGAYLLISLLLLLPSTAFAIDHDNIDGGRPLRFDDAESIGLRERALEYGFSPTWTRGSRFRVGLTAEYLFGFALNSYYSVDFDADTENIGRLGLGYFRNIQRETIGSPGLAFRVDTYLPTGTDPESQRGVDFRLRGILSKTIKGNERLHLNLDGIVRTAAGAGNRTFLPSATLGYTRPVGYPRRFDRTALAEIAYRTDERRGTGGIVSVGAGMRQQVTPRSVVDVGIQSDVSAARGATKDNLRLIAGYSTSF